MPDITLVQKLGAAVTGAITAITTCLVLFDVLTIAQAGGITGAFGALVGVYVAADAVIRNGRSRVLQNPESVRELAKLPAPHVRK